MSPINLSTDWSVSFGDSGTKVTMSKLTSWTDDASTKNFSGVATYEKTVNIPTVSDQPLMMTFGNGKPLSAARGGRAGNGMQAYMDSPVHEAAVVYINDKRIGSVWAPPYTLDVSGVLKAGDNQIRIEVGNLAINYMAGHRFPNYDLTSIRQQFGNRFDPQNVNNLQPITAGLMGPIQIVAKGGN
jgi:hypothetical protein